MKDGRFYIFSYVTRFSALDVGILSLLWKTERLDWIRGLSIVVGMEKKRSKSG